METGKFTVIQRELTPEQRQVYDYHHINKAVIVNYGGDGMVLDYVGGHLAQEIEAMSHHLGDLGLDDAPEGISVWEGWWSYSKSPESYCGAVEYDAEPRGAFRPPTDEEWEVIRQGGCPWDASIYVRGPHCDVPPIYRVEGTVDGRHAKFHVCEAHKEWPARAMFDEGFEMRAQRIDELKRIDMTKATRGCYAPEDWKLCE